MTAHWHGEDLSGRALWVRAEQGLGDEILYASMLDDLLERGCNVRWEADDRLLPLLRRAYPDVAFLPRVDDFEPIVDFYCPAGNLGRYLRRNVADFPARRPRYLVADRRASLAIRQGFKDEPIGISWCSSNPKVGGHKSIPLDQFAPILADMDRDFVALQNDPCDGLLSTVSMDLHNDIDGLAALIWACEAVVTVSNTVAHLAGALGVPVHVLVPSNIGRFWYWGYEGEKSLWYPTATIHRQVGSDWGPAIRGVAERREV